ncbi:MAG: hypothetical protein OXC48_04730 [Endozoicomonadaceae bacterium]|nr:hypothetical protein [Endozoicomonadaceae bacterium]
MTQLFSAKSFITMAIISFYLFNSLFSFASLPKNAWLQPNRTITEKSLFKQSSVESLKQLDQLISQFPPNLFNHLKNDINKQIKAFNTEPLAYSTAAFLVLLSQQIKQIHKVKITKGTFNNQDVYYISLGYLAFYIIRPDGKQAFVWNKYKQQWTELESESIHHVKALWQMKKKYQPRSWILTPVSAYITDTITADTTIPKNKNAFSKELIFPETINQHIKEQLWTINQRLKKSSLCLLLPQALTFNSEKPLYSLQIIITELTRLISQGAQISYTELTKHKPANSQNNSRCLFAGPFAVILEDTFFYKDFSSNKLQEVDEQPGLAFSLQAGNVFQSEKVTLIPVDPFFNNYFNSKKGKLSDYFFSDGFTLILCLFGLICLIPLCVRTGITLLSMRYIKINRCKILRQLLKRCQQESQEKWINFMYAMLLKEKKLQKRIERWIINFILCIACSGVVVTSARFFKIEYTHIITATAVIQALVPLTLATILCILLLVGHAFIITIHRFFLLRLEDSSWKLLFNRKTLNKQVTIELSEA